MDIIYEIRRRHLVQGQTVSAIARDMDLSRPTVRKYLDVTEDRPYQRQQPVSRQLGAFEDQLTAWLEEDIKLALLHGSPMVCYQATFLVAGFI